MDRACGGIRTAGRGRAEGRRGFRDQSHVELLKRPEVDCAIIATDEHLHVDPIIAAVERGIPLIEKPLATDLAQSAGVLKAIEDAKIDAVVGYTQRFRRNGSAARRRCAPARSAM